PADIFRRAGAYVERSRGDRMRLDEREQCNPQRAGRGKHTLVIARQLDFLPARAQELDRGNMKRIERAQRKREWLERPSEHGGSQLDQRDAADQRSRLLPVRSSQSARVNPSPQLVFEKAARDQGFLPQPVGRRAVFCKQVRKRDRRVEVDHRSSRSCLSSSIRARKAITGLRGGGVPPTKADWAEVPIRPRHLNGAHPDRSRSGSLLRARL